MRSLRVILGLGSSWTPGRRWCGSWRAGAALALLCLTVYLPGFFTIPPVDRDESRFAQASRQMFESVALPKAEQREGFHDGGLVIPKFQDKPRLNKPPMIYWLQAAAAAAFTGGDPLRDAIWMYRVPSLLAAIVTVLATWRIGLWMFDARAAALGAALLAVCPLFAWEAHQARADHVMVAATTVAMGAMWRIWRSRATDRRSGRSVDSGPSPSPPTVPTKRGPVGGTFAAIVLWLALGVGILTKGPITPLIVASAAAALCVTTRRWWWLRRTRPVLGAVVLAAMVGPWAWAVGERIGWETCLGIVRDEVLGRSVEAKEGHWGPPGYHAVLLAVLFWPGSLTTAWAVGRAWRRALPATSPPRKRGSLDVLPRLRGGLVRIRRHACGRDAELFCLAWIIPAWIVFELVGTKLPHYTMPMYPAVALVSARAAFSRVPARAVGTWGSRAWLGLGMVFVLSPAVAQMTLLWDRGIGGLAVAAAVVVVPLHGLRIAARRLAAGRTSGALAAAGACWVVPGAALLGIAAPDAAGLTRRAVAAVTAADAGGGRPIAAAGFGEPSLVFLTRGRISLLGRDETGAWWRGRRRGLIIIPAEDRLRFHRVLGEAEGWHYTRGSFQRLLVVAPFPEPDG